MIWQPMLTALRIPVKIGVIGRCEPIGPAQLGSGHANEVGADEVGLAGGDSGGPMFIGGAIAGVNWSTAQPPIGDVNSFLDASWGEASFFMRVSYNRDFILTATNGTAMFVPEPSTLFLLLGAYSSLRVRLASRMEWGFSSPRPSPDRSDIQIIWKVHRENRSILEPRPPFS
jgi:hypothetical protein